MKSAGDAPFMEAAGSRSTHPPASPPPPIELPDGSVIVPAHLAGAVRRILVRDLAQHVRADGGAPTAAVRALVYELARAEHHHDQAATLPSSGSGTPPAASPIVEISTSAAAVSLGCSAEFVRRLCRSERLSGRRIGRAWLIDPVSLDAYRYRTEEP